MFTDNTTNTGWATVTGHGRYSAADWWQMVCFYGLSVLMWGATVAVAAVDRGLVIWVLPLFALGATFLVGARILLALRDEAVAPIEESCYTTLDASKELAMPIAVKLDEFTAAIHHAALNNPEWISVLVDAVEWETAHPPAGQFNGEQWGWEWFDVHAKANVLNDMVAERLLDVASRSRSSTNYRLPDLAATKEAIDVLRDVSRPAASRAAKLDPDKMFTYVFGMDAVLGTVRAALLAERPVHILLIGPPGSAKTSIISEIGDIPNAEMYAMGSSTSKSGLVGLLLEKEPRYLVLDEIDKAKAQDTSPLLNLMEGGWVTVLLHKRRERKQMTTSVFAACNDETQISPPILSRFIKIHIPPYTKPQFIEVAQAVLTQKDGFGTELAKLVANRVADYSLDVRQARYVGALVKRHPETIDMHLRTIFPEARVSLIRGLKG